MTERRAWQVPIYPLAFVLTFLVTKYLESWAPLQVLVRPLVVFVVAAMVIQLATSRLWGRDLGAFAFALVFLLLFDFVVASLVVVAVVVYLAVRSIVARRLQPLDWGRLTGALNVVGVAALLVTVGGGLASGGFRVATTPNVQRPAAAADAPDIYLLLVDAYPRADTLQAALGLDISPFLENMRGAGFEVAEDARSNYTMTGLTLASLFNARHMDELMPAPPGNVAAQARTFSELINTGTQLQVAREAGYEVVTLAPPIGYVTLYAADVVIDRGYLSEFEIALTQEDLLQRLGTSTQREFFLEQHRARIIDVFESLEGLAEGSHDRPRLVFGHVLAPHPPFAFGPTGEAIEVVGCLWTMCDLRNPLPEPIREAARGQVEYVNTLLERTTTAIVERSERPVAIVIFSDHGFRFDPNDRGEAFRSLLLSYTPGHPGTFPPAATPINILPRVLNAYAGASVPLAAEDSYWVTPGGGPNGFFPLEVTPVD